MLKDGLNGDIYAIPVLWVFITCLNDKKKVGFSFHYNKSVQDVT